MNVINEKNEPSKEFFIFLKYNKIGSNFEFSNKDDALYNEFVNKWLALSSAFSRDNDDSKSLFGSIVTMFGYNRHYCNICSSPIIGKYDKIGGRIACNDCFESLKIIQQIENLENREVKQKK